MSPIKPELKDSEHKYLELLATRYPDMRAASSEIINLQAILNLPKGTEFFLSDIHGEYEAFTHMLKSASGVIKHKVNEVFGATFHARERNSLLTLIYYPEEKLNLIKAVEPNMEEWYGVTLRRLIKVCRIISSKYTRSKVRKALPKDFAYIIEELLHEQNDRDKEDYYNQIIKTVIDTGSGDAFVIALCKLIQKLAVDRLHILGDIFDRGPGAELIMDALMEYNVVDIQWGNHD
ncbi:MAG: fructose-1,6-bisphosphatase, partial [Clostridia bacterium]|nr:fructose-1,6-bisphosphatase [Clostridia bacterium]